MTKTYDKFLDIVIAILAFLMPLFFLPTTTEFFELNKLALLTIATIVLAIVWGIKILLNKELNFVKSPITPAIAVFVAIFIASTVFSLNPASSVFGRYGRWFPSLFSLIVFVFFFYITAANITINFRNKVIWCLLAGTTIASLIGIASYFGIYLSSAEYAQLSIFNTAGSTTSVALMAVLGVILALGLVAEAKLIPTKLLLAQIAAVNFSLVAFFNIPSVWPVLLFGLGFFSLKTGIKVLNKEKPYYLVTIGIALAVLLITLLPHTSDLIKNETFIRESSPGFRNSWVVASKSTTDYPILGTGPSTFHINFSRYKPLALNTTPYWNVRFDKPNNEILNIMSTMGIVGVLAFIFVGIKAAQMALRSKDVLLGVTALTLLVAFLFNYATVLTSFLLFLILALISAINDERINLSISSLGESLGNSAMSLLPNLGIDTSKGKKNEVIHYISAIPLVVFSILAAYYLYKNYTAEYYMRKSITAAQQNNAQQVYDYQQKALSVNGLRGEYHNSFAQINLVLATSLSQKENLSDIQKQNIQALVSQAIRSVRISTEVVNPLLVGSWETRAGIYKALIGSAQDADQWALGAYNNAIQLDPTNPRLRLEAGGIYFAKQDFLAAANLFRQATNLKPNYANAHYNLAQALKQLQNYELTKQELEITAQLVTENSEDHDLVMRELDEVNNLIGETANQPTIPELEGSLEQKTKETDEQEPLTQPGEIEPAIDEADITLNTTN